MKYEQMFATVILSTAVDAYESTTLFSCEMVHVFLICLTRNMNRSSTVFIGDYNARELALFDGIYDEVTRHSHILHNFFYENGLVIRISSSHDFTSLLVVHQLFE
nr:hypothetical protein AUSP0005_00047 [uncultured phage]